VHDSTGKTPFWSRHVFVLISSDTLYRGLHRDLVDRLRKEGFAPVAARIVTTHPDMVDDLYSDLIAGQWRTWRYRLVDSLLALGPALPVICRSDVDDPHAVLAERKGYQHPEQAEPGTIRRDLGAINSVMNLIHSSDNPAEAQREAAVFGLSAADALDDPDLAVATVDHLCALAEPERPEHRDFDGTLAAVRARVIAQIWEDLPAPDRDRVRTAFPRRATLAAHDAGERLGGLLTGHVPEPVRRAVECDYTPPWRDRIRMSDAVAALRRAGVTLDPWEHLVLESSLQFPPLRRTGAGS
jgi:nucleoside diphosphate kinase